MDFIQVFFLLFIVMDPIGNVPLLLALLKGCQDQQYKSIVIREALFAFGILALFLWQGDLLIYYLNIDPSSLSIAGGVILFMISIRMIFKGSHQVFENEYRDDPWFVPVAMPAIAGPTAITTVILLKSKNELPISQIFIALALAVLLNTLLLLFSRRLSKWLGAQGINALDRLMGMLLSIISVNMMLSGIKEFFQQSI